MSETSIHIVRAETPEGFKDYVTVVPPETLMTRGLIPEAIIGVLTQPLDDDDAITPDNFARNSVFVAFLHDVIARHGPQQPGLVAEAARIGNGTVAIIDGRTPTPEGPVPPEDIMGAFVAKGGKIETGSYVASPYHRILTVNGFFQLDGGLMDCLLGELEARTGKPH
jgi:hypothetical protein